MNPDRLNITLWQKLGKQEYRIKFDKDIDSMQGYVLVKDQSLAEALELKRIWEERVSQ